MDSKQRKKQPRSKEYEHRLWKKSNPVRIEKRYLYEFIQNLEEKKYEDEEQSYKNHRLIDEYGKNGELALQMCLSASKDSIKSTNSALYPPPTYSNHLLCSYIRLALMDHKWNLALNLVVKLLKSSRTMKNISMMYIFRVLNLCIFNLNIDTNQFISYLSNGLGLRDDDVQLQYLKTLFTLPDKLELRAICSSKRAKIEMGKKMLLNEMKNKKLNDENNTISEDHENPLNLVHKEEKMYDLPDPLCENSSSMLGSDHIDNTILDNFSHKKKKKKSNTNDKKIHCAEDISISYSDKNNEKLVTSKNSSYVGFDIPVACSTFRTALKRKKHDINTMHSSYLERDIPSSTPSFHDETIIKKKKRSNSNTNELYLGKDIREKSFTAVNNFTTSKMKEIDVHNTNTNFSFSVPKDAYSTPAASNDIPTKKRKLYTSMTNNTEVIPTPSPIKHTHKKKTKCQL